MIIPNDQTSTSGPYLLDPAAKSSGAIHSLETCIGSEPSDYKHCSAGDAQYPGLFRLPPLFFRLTKSPRENVKGSQVSPGRNPPPPKRRWRASCRIVRGCKGFGRLDCRRTQRYGHRRTEPYWRGAMVTTAARHSATVWCTGGDGKGVLRHGVAWH